MELEMRKATMADLSYIHARLLDGAGILLPRSLPNLYRHVRDFYVVCSSAGDIVGCNALSIVWDDLAEVRSLFLEPKLRGKGIGKKLVEIGIDEIKGLGIRRVFTLTYNTAFFSSLGFEVLPKESLPQKVWADCVNCPKFPDCDEIAMVKNLAE